MSLWQGPWSPQLILKDKIAWAAKAMGSVSWPLLPRYCFFPRRNGLLSILLAFVSYAQLPGDFLKHRPENVTDLLPIAYKKNIQTSRLGIQSSVYSLVNPFLPKTHFAECLLQEMSSLVVEI